MADDTQAKTLRSTNRSLPIALLRARETVMAPIREMLADAGVTEQQWRVLGVLQETGPLDGTELANRASLLAPSLTRITQTLQSKDFVSREGSQTDRRRQMFAITRQGRNLLDRYRDQALTIANATEARLGTEKLNLLLDLLGELQDPMPELRDTRQPD